MGLHIEVQGLLAATDPRDNTVALTTFQDFYDKIPPYTSIRVARLYALVTYNMIATSKILDVFLAFGGRWQIPQRELEDMPS
jgi:hypothetical protein